MTRPTALARLNSAQIELQLHNCARLPSLGSIDRVLRELVNAEQCFTSQVADVIRRDPSMTTRLLRLVNSVYFGLTLPVTSIEEAVFYLGVRQVRQLAMVTPVVEDLQRFAGKDSFPWHAFWQHCVGTAILTPEIMGDVQSSQDETDYVSGLLHDVGKIAIAAAKNFGATSFGIEYNKEMAELATRNTERAGVADKVKIINGDIFVEGDFHVYLLYAVAPLARVRLSNHPLKSEIL